MENRSLSQEFLKFHTADASSKSDPKYGKVLAEKLLATVKNGNNSWYATRNNKFKNLRRLAQGNMETREFLDYMNIDGKQSYINLDLTPPKILPKFLEIVVDRFMEYEERPTVEAVDDRSKRQRQRDMDEAEFAMNNSRLIQGLEEQAGMPLVDPNQYVPESYDDLQLHFQYEYKLPEEIRFQRKIYDTLKDSDSDLVKRAVLDDLCEVGIGVMFVYRDSQGNKKYRRVIPENFICGWSNKEDFSDSPIKGEVEKMKISDLRLAFPELGEKKLFEMWQKTNQTPVAELRWSDDFESMLIRPYDDAVVDVLHFQVVTTETGMWVEKKDKFGRSVLNKPKEKPKYLGENKTLIEKRYGVVYSGCYCESTGEILEWKLQEGMIKPHQALHEVFDSYVVFMPKNRNMSNVSLVERAVTPIRMMTLTLLKIQQIIAKLRPDGVAVDIRGWSGVNLSGNPETADFTSPLELMKIYDQTGNVLYSSIDDDGEMRKNIPVTPINSDSNVGKLQALVEQFNLWQNRLRDDLGINEYVEGQAVNPKLGLGVMQNQVQASNRATNFVYNGYLHMMKNVAKRIAIMDWYDIVENGDPRYGITPDGMADKVFDINIEMAPTDQDRQYIDTLTQTALTAQLITFEEAIKVRRIAKEDVKLAEIYLAKYERKRKRDAQQEAQQNSMVQAQVQQQSLQAKAQIDAYAAQAKGAVDLQKQDKINQGANANVLGQLFNTVIGELVKQGKTVADMDPSLIPLFQAFMQNMGVVQQAQTQSTAMDMQQQQMQMMQGQEQSQEEQETEEYAGQED